MLTIISLFLVSIILLISRQLELYYNLNFGKKPKYLCIIVMVIGLVVDVCSRLFLHR